MKTELDNFDMSLQHFAIALYQEDEAYIHKV